MKTEQDLLKELSSAKNNTEREKIWGQIHALGDAEEAKRICPYCGTNGRCFCLPRTERTRKDKK